MVFLGIYRINNKCFMLFRCYKFGFKILVCVYVKMVFLEWFNLKKNMFVISYK